MLQILRRFTDCSLEAVRALSASNIMKSVSQSTKKIQLAIIFLTYLILALIFGFAYRYAMNPDGISQLRLAGYIADGNFQHSVTHAWSPLISWIFSFFIYLGFEGLTAARISISLCGAGLLLNAWFMTLRFDLSQNIRLIASLIAALLISFWTIQFIAADVLFAALILCYLFFTTEPDILKTSKTPFFCGLIGGFSFLAHHYAFPFFLVHFPAILFLRGYIDRNRRGFHLKKILISWGVGITGFFIIASIWVAVVSVKYGHFTISSKGSIAHASLGPKDTGHPFFSGGLYKPRDTYAIHVFEDPSEVEFKTWSPFESKEYFIHQLKLIKMNINYIFKHFVRESPFFTYPFIVVTLSLIPIALLLNPLNKRKKYLYSWVIITFSIYCSGFLLITARSPRRFYALMVIFLFLSLHFLEELKNGIGHIVTKRRKKFITYYILIVVVLAFTLKPSIQFIKSFKTVVTLDQVNPYREIAEQIRTIEFPSPYAIIRSAQKPYTDYYIAYFLKKQLLGRPVSRDAEGITKELREADAKTLVVFDNMEIVEKLMKDKRYMHVGTLILENNKKYLNPINTKIDQITGWDKKINIYKLKL